MLLVEMVHCLAMFCVFVAATHSTARPQVVDGENTPGFEGFRICYVRVSNGGWGWFASFGLRRVSSLSRTQITCYDLRVV